MSTRKKVAAFFAFLSMIFLIGISFVQAAGIDTTDKWAWSEEVGFINFNTFGGSVDVTNTQITGHAWIQQY